VRTALPLPDPADVLLDRLAMAGEPFTRRPRPVRLALASGRFLRAVHRRSPPPPAPDRSTCRDDDPVRVGDRRVAQLHLDPEDRPQPDLLVGRRRPDDTVQPLVVGHAEPGQPELDGSFGQLVGCRRAIEKGEVRVAVELGIRGHRDR
jgi:hypothetical protein